MWQPHSGTELPLTVKCSHAIMDGGKYEETGSVISDATGAGHHGGHGATIMNTLDFSRIEEMDPSTGTTGALRSLRQHTLPLTRRVVPLPQPTVSKYVTTGSVRLKCGYSTRREARKSAPSRP